ncbi:hypothetical protein AB205_0196880, partial [Aquarana catesbeiana]
MTTMADGLEAQDSSKSAFMEFGQQSSHSQQSSPAMAASHYPLHCLHSGSHPHHHHHHQHDTTSYPGTNSQYGRSLAAYPYMSQHSPYLQSYNSSSSSSTATQTRAEEPGEKERERETGERMSVVPLPNNQAIAHSTQNYHYTTQIQDYKPSIAVKGMLQLTLFLLLQNLLTLVKIWFQNKRSKYKKLLKQGGNPHESDPLPVSAALSPRSPAIPPVWDVTASAKGVNIPPNSYMPTYSHWYSSPHQDTMQRSQM